MITPTRWRKSSFSGGGEGNDCVEIASFRTRVAIRDSKVPADATLTFRLVAFTAFVEVLKADSSRTAA
ncbi:DUF397 domain-containing protein [Streptomyces sp. SID12488]|uniref:DUF397 domain-containing protein n=1 Tax=Streptomyces sp. SID12488 TaxID=2706040 RepID=UPI0013D97CC6|nr:DUF397 domain-containing protein [Streptomyces sp. SID12488]NEA68969.1 DUF397 domain-containing protein [Streptomyces sp. SID12488]